MNTTGKDRSFINRFSGVDRGWQRALIDGPRTWFADLKRKFSNLPKTNFDLGVRFTGSGQWLDAMFRFKLAVWLQPNFPQAWYNLGCCCMKLRRYDKARHAFKKTLALKPTHTDAIYMLSSLEPAAIPPAMRPTRMPAAMIVDFFTGMAPVYDGVERQNRYQGPRLVFDAVKALLKQTNGLHVFDIGCGTGLCSRPWRTLAVAMTGLDFTSAMVEVAKEVRINDKPLFETLTTADILDIGANTLPERAMDVVLCIDTAQFLGELSNPFGKAARMLKPGGLFAVTVEPFTSPVGYAVNPDTGRFGHHADYVKKTAASAGLELKKEAKVNLYANLPAALFIFAAKEGV